MEILVMIKEKNCKAFTLIELLVLIVIAPLLAQFIASVLVDFIGGSIYPELWPFIGLLLWPFVGYILFYILVFLTSNKNKYGKHIILWCHCFKDPQNFIPANIPLLLHFLVFSHCYLIHLTDKETFLVLSLQI